MDWKHGIVDFAKGFAMGAANVIPGVSGGTIALITGIYARLLAALKHCDIQALRLLLKRDWSAFARRIDLALLVPLGLGVVVSILTLARLLEWLLADHPVPTFAFFFGLIVASLPCLAREVSRWTPPRIATLLMGCGVAAGVAFLAPAQANPAMAYLFLCGVLAICSMILPGLSGSFILILLGNYALVLEAINRLQLDRLIPFTLGCGFGLLAFAHLLTWVFRRYPDRTHACMTGFVAGSLLVLWPWKSARTVTQSVAGETQEIAVGYTWSLPALDASFLLALVAASLGVACLTAVEWLARRKPSG
ncbi:MAG: DUF368 domain-containing protein [Opitutales bacterium]